MLVLVCVGGIYNGEEGREGRVRATQGSAAGRRGRTQEGSLHLTYNKLLHAPGVYLQLMHRLNVHNNILNFENKIVKIILLINIEKVCA